MKKVNALILVMVILLCGCSASAGSQDDGSQSANNGGQGISGFFSNIVDSIGDALKITEEAEPLLELGQGAKHDSLMILKITINPEFDLYLDADGCISRVRCLNEDAVQVFQHLTGTGASVIGQDYFAAMPVILDSAAELDYLNSETDRIQIETTIHIEVPEEELTELTDTLAEAVVTYAAENNLTLKVEAPEAEVDTKVAQALPEFDVQTAKPNAVITHEASRDGSDGTYTEYFDENGILCKAEGNYENGSYTLAKFAPNGCITYHEVMNADGSGYIEVCDANGTRVSYTNMHADGTRVDTTYHSNGNPATYHCTYPDGRVSEAKFNKAGIDLYSKTVMEDGTITESTRYDNGNVKSTVSDGPDGYFEWHNFEDGTQSKYIERSEQGYHETVYHANGHVAVRISQMGTSSDETRYDESGEIIYQWSETANRSYLFENGALRYYIENGEEITDPEHLAALAMAMGFT